MTYQYKKISSKICIAIIACTSFYLQPVNAVAQNQADTAIIRRNIKTAADSLVANPKFSLQLAKVALETSNKLNNVYGQVHSLLAIGKAELQTGEKAGAIASVEEALQISRKNIALHLDAIVLLDLAKAHGESGNYKKAFELEQEAIKIAQVTQDTLLMAEIFSNIGKSLTNLTYYESAVTYQRKSIQLYEKANDFAGAAKGWLNIAAVLLYQEKYEEAFPYVLRSLHIYDSIKAIPPIVPYMNLALAYDGTGKKDSALHYYLKALGNSRLLKDKKNEQIICNNIATLMEELKRIPAAESYYKQALKANSGNHEAAKNIYMNLGDLYANKGDFKQAYFSQLNAFYASDSFLNLEKVHALAELTTKFETQQLAFTNAQLEKKINAQKYTIIRTWFFVYGSLTITIILILLALLYYRQNRFKMRVQRMEMEQQQYHAQMNPHFIFNCLNSIQHYIVHNDVFTANKYLSEFALLMRKTMDNNKHQATTVSSEIAYLQHYLSLEQMRFENKFTFNISCSEEVHAYDMKIFPMLIQPFAENAIMHGLCYSGKKGSLEVRFEKEEKSLVCTIEDNGIGRQASAALKKRAGNEHESRGLEMVQKRIALVKTLTKQPYQLSIIDKHDAAGKAMGTLIILKLPQDI